jgi:hypothetical protein
MSMLFIANVNRDFDGIQARDIRRYADLARKVHIFIGVNFVTAVRGQELF